jgi:hypothetical protein
MNKYDTFEIILMKKMENSSCSFETQAKYISQEDFNFLCARFNIPLEEPI